MEGKRDDREFTKHSRLPGFSVDDNPVGHVDIKVFELCDRLRVRSQVVGLTARVDQDQFVIGEGEYGIAAGTAVR